MEIKIKIGQYNPETDKYFVGYRKGKEKWVIEKYFLTHLKRREDQKIKMNDYYKNWYKGHTDRHKQTTKESFERLKISDPLRLLMRSIKHSSKIRNHEVSINKEFLEELWNKQKGLCFYTKIAMEKIAHKKSPFQVSVDRKDSNKGYTEDNIVLCCQSINYAKNDYKLDDFLKFLKCIKND